MKNIIIGQKIQLKSERARAYGEPENKNYTVIGTFQKLPYKKLWIQVAEFPAPFNVFESRDLR